jgi:hypothetical protein
MWFLLSFIVISAVVLVLSRFEIDDELIARMLIAEDREEIYSFALNLVFESLIIGNGSVLLDESVGFTGFPSFHNSYLDVAVRHGILALIIFLLILIPDKKNRIVGGVAFALTILFFLIGSAFQNFLKHPHIIMIYMVCINSGYLFCKKNEIK